MYVSSMRQSEPFDMTLEDMLMLSFPSWHSALS